MNTLITRPNLKRFIIPAVFIACFLFASTAKAQTYCIPVYQWGCKGIAVTTFKLGSINYSGNNCNSTTYNDYTSTHSTTLMRGKNYTWTMATSYNNHNMAIWIDMNDDGDFDDAGEFIYSTSSLGVASDNFTVPGTATVGEHRMRVRMKFHNPVFAANESCAQMNEGETQDYKVTIEGSAPYDAGAFTIDSPMVFCPGVQTVAATIKNFGNKVLDSVMVNWSVAGVTQPAVKFVGKLDTAGGSGSTTAKVKLGTYNFSAAPHKISVWTSLPNNIADTINNNDTIHVTRQSVSLPVANAGADIGICIGKTAKIGSNPPAGTTYSWTSDPAGYTSTDVNPTVTPTVTTTYKLIAKNANGCTAEDEITVFVNPLPVAPALTDVEICKGESTQVGVSADTNLIYTWTSKPAGFTSNASQFNVSPTVTTTYYLNIRDNRGCTDDAEVTVTVNPLPVANAGSDQSFCKGGSVQIGAAANTSYTYSWTSLPAGFSSLNSNPTVSPTVTTTYYLTVKTRSGCIATDEVVVQVNPIPVAEAGNAAVICEGQSVTIGASAEQGITYSWTSSPAGFTSGTANPVVSPATTTTYTVVAKNPLTGCMSEDFVTVTVNNNPIVDAGATQTICLGDSANIGTVAEQGFNYSWSSSPAGFSSTDANLKVSPKVKTVYTLVATNANACSAQSQVTVNVNPLPVANAGQDKSICIGGSVAIGSPSTPGVTYKWTSIPEGFTSISAAPFVNPDVTTTYKLLATNTTGCIAEDEMTVVVENASAGFTAASEGLTSTFTADDNSHAKYTWTFGDGASGNGATATHKYSKAGTYTVKLSVISAGGCSATEDSAITVISTGFKDVEFAKNKFNVYPNPFNKITNISYELPQRGFVKILVTDLQGRTVSNILEAQQPKGNYTQEINFGEVNLQTGIYFLHLQIDGISTTRKIIKL